MLPLLFRRLFSKLQAGGIALQDFGNRAEPVSDGSGCNSMF